MKSFIHLYGRTICLSNSKTIKVERNLQLSQRRQEQLFNKLQQICDFISLKAGRKI